MASLVQYDSHSLDMDMEHDAQVVLESTLSNIIKLQHTLLMVRQAHFLLYHTGINVFLVMKLQEEKFAYVSNTFKTPEQEPVDAKQALLSPTKEQKRFSWVQSPGQGK